MEQPAYRLLREIIVQRLHTLSRRPYSLNTLQSLEWGRQFCLEMFLGHVQVKSSIKNFLPQTMRM